MSDTATIQPSQTAPTVGRILYCFRPAEWAGPLPAIVTHAHDTVPPRASVTVFGVPRSLSGGLSFTGLVVYDPPPPQVAPEEATWLEWMPYQTQQREARKFAGEPKPTAAA